MNTPINTYINNLKKPFYPTPTGQSLKTNAVGTNAIAPTPTGKPLANMTPVPTVKPTSYPMSTPQATSPKPTVITPPKSTLPQSGQQYAQNLANTPQPGAPFQAPLNPYNPTNGINPVAPTQPVEKKSTSKDQYLNAYKSYVDSLKESADVKEAKTAYLDFVKSKKEGLQQTGEQRIPMRFITGQQASMEKRAADEEANLLSRVDLEQNAQKATQDSLKAGVDMYGKILELEKPVEVDGALYKVNEDGSYEQVIAGKSSKEGFTLGKDQARWEINPQTGQYEQVAGSAGGTGEGGISSTASFWADAINKGTAKLSDVPQDDRAGVIQAMSSGPEKTTPLNQRAIDQANTALSQFTKILENPALSYGAVGRTLTGMIPGTSATDLRQSLSTIQALVGFNELQKMREASPTGGALGQVSEREIDFLQALAGSLKTTQSDEQLKSNIKEIKKSFEILKLVNSPSGTTLNVDGLNLTKQGDALLYQAPDGQVYQRQPDGTFTSFKSVGNTSASKGNIPQRNKNPGNIKVGGLADSLAIGKDNQGHLIFPDEATGFRAMAMDIEAKINGKSRYMSANPTLAQLGKVYAEDPNWPKSVAKILGVSPTTNTKDIPINSLIKAIARQEGYYA